MDMNMDSNNQRSYGGGLSLEEKKRVKQSIAKMMVYWVAHTRQDLLDGLIEGNPDGAWAGLALREAFDRDDDWRAFFAIASDLFNEEAVVKGARRIRLRVRGEDGLMDSNGNRVEEDWDLDPESHCPEDRTLNVMARAAFELVDSND